MKTVVIVLLVCLSHSSTIIASQTATPTSTTPPSGQGIDTRRAPTPQAPLFPAPTVAQHHRNLDSGEQRSLPIGGGTGFVARYNAMHAIIYKKIEKDIEQQIQQEVNKRVLHITASYNQILNGCRSMLSDRGQTIKLLQEQNQLLAGQLSRQPLG